MVRKIAIDAIRKTKEEEKLKHLKKESAKSYLLFGAVTLFGVIGINLFLELAFATTFRQAYQEMPDALRTNAIIGSISVMAVALAEAVVFRGMVHNVVRRSYNMSRAILMSSLLYGLYHMNDMSPFYSITTGCLMAYAYEYFGDFKAPLLIHMVANVLTFLVTSTALVNTAVVSWPVCIVCLAIMAVSVKMILNEKKILQ